DLLLLGRMVARTGFSPVVSRKRFGPDTASSASSATLLRLCVRIVAASRPRDANLNAETQRAAWGGGHPSPARGFPGAAPKPARGPAAAQGGRPHQAFRVSNPIAAFRRSPDRRND